MEDESAIVVGVNRFQIGDEDAIPILRVDPVIEQDQVARLRSVREKRDAAAAESSINKLTEAAQGSENMLPRILECVENNITVGEISHALRKVWGEYREAVTL